MSPEQFCYWVQGFLEVSQTSKIDEKQVQIIKDHLNLVFNKKTPSYEALDLQKQMQQTRKLTGGFAADDMDGGYERNDPLLVAIDTTRYC